MKVGFQNDEDRNYKFDARLRYVENLINSWIIFVQAESDRKTKDNITPRDSETWRSSLHNLYYLLSLHDTALDEPPAEVTDEYIKSLLKHNLIVELTQNKVVKNDPSQAIRNKFKI